MTHSDESVTLTVRELEELVCTAAGLGAGAVMHENKGAVMPSEGIEKAMHYLVDGFLWAHGLKGAP